MGFKIDFYICGTAITGRYNHTAEQIRGNCVLKARVNRIKKRME
jgi:hypothetical protein